MQKRWLIVWLLFLVQVVNFIDKAVLGLAAVPMMEEIGLSPEQYGLLASSFFSLYALSGLLVALIFAPRFSPRTILTVLLAVWAIAQIPIIFTSSLMVLLACRALLGAAEGPGTPTVISAVHEWFPSESRTLPTTVVMIGTTAGSLIAAPLLSYIIAAYGWRAAFATCSVLGSAVLFCWWYFGNEPPNSVFDSKRQTRSGQTRISARWIWTDPTVIGLLIAGFCAYWCLGFAISWTAPWLRNALGQGVVSTGWLMSLIFLGQGVISLAGGAVSQHLTRLGISSRKAHGWLIGAAQLGAVAALLGSIAAVSLPVKIFLFLLATGLPSLTFTLGPSIISEMVPQAQRNGVIGVILSIVTVSGMIAPYVSGLLIGRRMGTAGYDHAFMLCAALLAIGGLISIIMLKPERSSKRMRTLGQI